MAKRPTRRPLDDEEKRKLNKENLRKLGSIFQYMKPYKGSFMVGLFFLLLSSSTLMTFPYIAGKLLDVASGKGGFFLDNIHHITALLLGILAIQSVFSFLRVYLFARVSENAMAGIRSDIFSRMMHLPMSFFDRRRSGELISRITADVSLLQDTFSTTLAELIRQLATLIIGMAFIFYTTPSLSLFMLATFPFLVLFAMIFGRYIRRLSKKTQDELAAANVIVEEALQSIQTVKAFTGEWFEGNRYAQSMSRVVRIAMRSATYRAAFISFIIFALFGGIVMVMWYGASLVQQGEMSVGDLLSFVLYTTFIGGSIAGLGDLYGQIQRAIGASERLLEIKQEKGESSQSKEPDKNVLSIKGSIRYENLHFSYPTRNNFPVLLGLNLDIQAGEKIALVGHSGAGKSTIAQLLMRFYQPDQGHIWIDGEDLQKMDLHQYRAQVGIVPQEVLLFGGSIRENIAYGKPGASLEEVEEAARKANALDFIQSFPEGLETKVGERGIKLSGGQRQRIAIARAILKDPKILILDEATSSLDAESEKLVQDALERLMADRTTLIIAHRLATIRMVDTIYVLHDGKIIESGNHLELSAKMGGAYSKLIRLQMQEAYD